MTSIYPSKKKAPAKYVTEFDVLRSAHRFLRAEDDPETSRSWDAQLAKKYEDSLFKEFAVCDLKHFKSGNIALRWRTEDEVLSAAGENTCGNTRCSRHQATEWHGLPKLTTLELPFAYTEQGETQTREAMVKVALCSRCVKKLMWKREQDKIMAGEPLKSKVDGEKPYNDKEEGKSSEKSKRERPRESHRHRSESPRRRH